MNWSKIETLLANCAKQPGATVLPDTVGLGNYSEVLKCRNGIEGCVGPDEYLLLWSAEQIPSLNAGYMAEEYAPGILLVGSNGGGNAYGRD